MQNPILRSTLIVLICWWTIIWAWGLFTHGLPEKLLHLETAAWALAGGGVTTLLAVAAVFVYRWITKGWLLATQTRGVVCSIGILPGLVRWPRGRRTAIKADSWPLTTAWLDSAPPDYAQAFRAIVAVLGADPTFPASPVATRRGQSLLVHSLNTVEAGLKAMDSWTWRHRQAGHLLGRGLAPADKHVAALILAGHDIGKLDAFEVERDRVVARKRSHDREGARLLATIDEIWRLPEDDRKTLIAVVAHEHHPQDLPQHAGESARLLLEFLIDVDTDAARQDTGAAGVVQDDEFMWAWFVDYLLKPGTINGKDKKFRIGFKGADGHLYLNEANLRHVLAEQCLRDASQAEHRLGDGRYCITLDLLRILAEKDALFCEWHGERYSYKNALFKVETRDQSGKLLSEWSPALIVTLGAWAPEALRAIPAPPHPPQIVEAVYPSRGASADPSAADDEDNENRSETGKSPPPPTGAPPAPALPEWLGGLGRAMLIGMRETGQMVTPDVTGRIELTVDVAADFATRGGIPHQGLEWFLEHHGQNELIMQGVEAVRDDAGALIGLRVSMQPPASLDVPDAQPPASLDVPDAQPPASSEEPDAQPPASSDVPDAQPPASSEEPDAQPPASSVVPQSAAIVPPPSVRTNERSPVPSTSHEDFSRLDYGTEGLPERGDPPPSKSARRQKKSARPVDSRASKGLTTLKPLTASAAPAHPPLPASLGALGCAMLIGMRKTGQVATPDATGRIELAVDVAADLVTQAGIPHQGLERFLEHNGQNEGIMRGVEAVRNDAGALIGLRVSM